MSTYSSLHHASSMNPALWSGLPEDLLQRVFARLHVAGIIRLQCLSKQWNRNVNSDDFKQVCADAHPQMFAIIPEYSFSGSFEIKTYDLRTNTWHKMKIHTGYRLPFHTMKAADGGLVCFACFAKEEGSIRAPMLVCNPLTRAVRALPLHSHHEHPPRMLQLVMDRITKFYKVLILCTDRNGGLVAEVFHSNTGAWTTTNVSDIKYISGYPYWWHDNLIRGYYPSLIAQGPCVYDCAEGHLLEIPVVTNQLRAKEKCAVVEDRIFVLCMKEAVEGGVLSECEYYIAEYQVLESGANYLKLKDHAFSNFQYPFHFSLLACKSFLLVVAPGFMANTYEHGLQRLYDLSTGKWHALSQGFLVITSDEFMCELQWNSVP